jgi:fumarate hydratase class II
MSTEFRVEADALGEMRVPASAYYGPQTARALESFPVSHLRFPRAFIRAMGQLKKHAAATNARLGLLPRQISDAIQRAAQEVIDGKWDDQFVVDIFQTASGTSTNMNANEVIANRATELLGGKLGDKTVHPNDHVNCGQSSNDVIPTAIHIAALDGVVHEVIPALNELHAALLRKSREFDDVLKIARTHLQDATPIRLGQEFGGYASQIEHAVNRLWNVEESLGELALGGTAVGTGINTHCDFARLTIEGIASETGLALLETTNHFDAQANIDELVEASGALKTAAVSLIKIANDIRWLGSGPRCGLGELKLPPAQPGTATLPGKVNPVLCEMVIKVGIQVIGNDAAVAAAGTFGEFQLNTMITVAAYNLFLTIDLLSAACRSFAGHCVLGIEADRDRCASTLEQSLALGAALAPVIGHDKATHIARLAQEQGRTVREVALEISGLEQARLDELLDPRRQTTPGTGAGWTPAH